MIISAYSKSSNFSGFNLILQKCYEMICEIIISNTVCGIFLFFCQSRFINNFMEKSNFSEPLKLNISRLIYLKKISPYRFEDLICTNKLDGFFFRKTFFQGLGAFFMAEKQLIWAPFFSTKIYFIIFFKGNYLILIYY